MSEQSEYAGPSSYGAGLKPRGSSRGAGRAVAQARAISAIERSSSARISLSVDSCPVLVGELAVAEWIGAAEPT